MLSKTYSPYLAISVYFSFLSNLETAFVFHILPLQRMLFLLSVETMSLICLWLMMDAKIQSEHHYVLCESKSIFLALVVNDVEDIRGGEVINGTTFFQIRVDVIGEYPRKVMSGVFGQFLFHVVSPPFRRSGSRYPGSKAMTGNEARLQCVADCGPFYLVYKKD